MRRFLVLSFVVMVGCGDNLAPEIAPSCMVAADCPGSTECDPIACTSGACVASPVAAGTPITMQTAGDCQQVQCDGSGGTMTVDDERDAPAGANECITFTCVGGTPQQGLLPLGAACGTGLQCDGGGDCVNCYLASQCPGSDTDCEFRTCLFGMCGIAFDNEGTPRTKQIAGDCAKEVCDGSGGGSAIIDNTDVPNDGNACTSDLCTNGVPSNPPEPDGTPCGTGSDACDGSGTCELLCGNGVIDSGEQCDGSVLGGATCQSEGFVDGVLACSSSCTFDLAGCSTCGDGVVSGDEACDGSAFAAVSCVSLGHAPGNLACSADCATIDTSGCTGGYIAANTSFTGTVCTDGLRYDGVNKALAVCTVDQGVWRGTLDAGTTPIADPVWINADGTTSGKEVTSLLGRGIAATDVQSKVVFFTTDTTSLNFFSTNSAGFTGNPPTWQTGSFNQVQFTQQIFSALVGSSTNNYMGGWDPVSGQAIVLHGNTVAVACTVNGGPGCAWPALLGAGVTGTVTSITTGTNTVAATTLDIHVAVTGTQPDGTAATGGGIYWSCDNGNSYVEDDNGIATTDKPLVFKVLADQGTFVAQATPRTCPTNSATVSTYASVMYAALLGGGSLYKTVDGGATWAPSNTGLPANVEVFSIAIDCDGVCVNDQLLYAATGAGIYKSTDAGAHWALDGLEGIAASSVVVEPQHDPTVAPRVFVSTGQPNSVFQTNVPVGP